MADNQSIYPGGRLTTESGVPISSSNRTAQGTLYYTPYIHNRISIHNGTAWQLITFAETSLSLTATIGKNYDVFGRFSAGAFLMTLSAAWTNDTSRADALTTQDGILVKSGDTTYRYLGTIRADGTNTIADSGGGTTTQVGGKRFVWNAYNRVLRSMSVIDTTSSWNYTTQAWRSMNNATANKVEYVVGDAGMMLWAQNNGIAVVNSNVSHAASIGVGIDGNTARSGISQPAYNAGASALVGPCNGTYVGYPGVGYHIAYAIEYGADGTCSFQGANGGYQAGLSAFVMG